MFFLFLRPVEILNVQNRSFDFPTAICIRFCLEFCNANSVARCKVFFCFQMIHFIEKVYRWLSDCEPSVWKRENKSLRKKHFENSLYVQIEETKLRPSARYRPNTNRAILQTRQSEGERNFEHRSPASYVNQTFFIIFIVINRTRPRTLADQM